MATTVLFINWGVCFSKIHGKYDSIQTKRLWEVIERLEFKKGHIRYGSWIIKKELYTRNTRVTNIEWKQCMQNDFKSDLKQGSLLWLVIEGRNRKVKQVVRNKGKKIIFADGTVILGE